MRSIRVAAIRNVALQLMTQVNDRIKKLLLTSLILLITRRLIDRPRRPGYLIFGDESAGF